MLDDEVVIRLLDHGAVRSADGQRLGRVGQLFRSDLDGEATWVSIAADDAPGGLQTLVPMVGSTVEGNDLQVAYPAAAVSGAPQVAEGAPVSGDDERRVREFYAIDPIAGDARDAEPGSAPPDVAVDDRPGVDDAPAAHGRQAADGAPTADDGAVVDHGAVVDDAPAPDDAAAVDDEAPVTDVLSVVRSEEQLAVSTQWVPVRRARLEKFQVTQTSTIEVQWTREDVRVVYEPLGEGEDTSPVPAAAPPRPWMLMEERIVVTKEWVPVETVRLVVDRVTGEQVVTEPVRKEQVELEPVEPAGSTTDQAG